MLFQASPVVVLDVYASLLQQLDERAILIRELNVSNSNGIYILEALALNLVG